MSHHPDVHRRGINHLGLRTMRWVVLLGILVVLAAPAGSQAAGCTRIAGSFSVVPGSAGAGNVVFALRLHNKSGNACLLSRLPQIRLLARAGAKPKPLPTKVVADPRYTPKPFLLRPGATATAQARFSPDVPGPGESVSGRCEPVAHYAAVVVGGTSIVLRVSPPTSVCEHGRLTFTPYH
jgi:hypothetical protein